MNTSKRGKKDTDLAVRLGQKWNQNLHDCMAQRGLERKTFAAAFKAEYGTGNATDVGRWLRVGERSRDSSIIGFPSYENMKRMADFFGVTVGYLTGETDFKSFEMEKACSYLGITEAAGTAIKRITDGKASSEHLNRLLRYENTAALCYLLTASHFNDFIGCLCDLAGKIDLQQNPIRYLDNAQESIPSELHDLAWEWRDYDFTWNDEEAPEVTPELLEAIYTIRRAVEKDFLQPEIRATDVKVAKYTLLEQHLKLIEEIVCPENMLSLVGIQNKRFSSTREMKEFLEASGRQPSSE